MQSINTSRSYCRRFRLDARDRQKFFHYLVPVSQTGEQTPERKTRKLLLFEKMIQRKMQQYTERVDQQFERVDQQFERVDQQFNCILGTMTKLDERLRQMQKMFGAQGAEEI